MAIVALAKITLYGAAADKDAVLDGLQKLGCVHLEDLRGGAARDVAAPSTEARAALQYLRDCPVQRRAVGAQPPLDVDATVRTVLEVRDGAHALAAEREPLQRAIAELEPWGSFALPEWARDGALKFRFYVVPHYDLAKLAGVSQPWRIVSRDQKSGYVVVISEAEPEGVPGQAVELDARPLAELQARLTAPETHAVLVDSGTHRVDEHIAFDDQRTSASN